MNCNVKQKAREIFQKPAGQERCIPLILQSFLQGHIFDSWFRQLGQTQILCWVRMFGKTKDASNSALERLRMISMDIGKGHRT